jgi:beta-xylosidase
LGVLRRNKLEINPWIEGAWMTKHKGIYYLQYAAPGTEFKSYADGVFTASKPTGPFVYAPYSLFSHKPTGFITAAGHGDMFQDKQGKYWKVATMFVGGASDMDRRVGIFPATFDEDGQLHADMAHKYKLIVSWILAEMAEQCLLVPASCGDPVAGHPKK